MSMSMIAIREPLLRVLADDLQTLGRLSQTCKRWRDATAKSSCWTACLAPRLIEELADGRSLTSHRQIRKWAEYLGLSSFPAHFVDSWDQSKWVVDPKALENTLRFYSFTRTVSEEDHVLHCQYEPTDDYYSTNQRLVIYLKANGATHFTCTQAGGCMEDQFYWEFHVKPVQPGPQAFWEAAHVAHDAVPSYDKGKALQKLAACGLANAELSEAWWLSRVRSSAPNVIPLTFDYGAQRYFAVDVVGGRGTGKRWMFVRILDLSNSSLPKLIGKILRFSGCRLDPPISTLAELTPYLKPRSFNGKGAVKPNPGLSLLKVYGKEGMCNCRRKKCQRPHNRK